MFFKHLLQNRQIFLFLCTATIKKYSETFCYNQNNLYFCATKEIIRKLSIESNFFINHIINNLKQI